MLPVAGTLFANRFEVEHMLGQGGMGSVFRARDRYSGDLIALKLQHDANAPRPTDDERFLREIRILSELRHPGIVAYVDHGRTPDGRFFLAMEWLEGETLAERLAQRPLALGEALTLFEQLAVPLSFAHQRGVIHRDLKPSNVFLVDGECSRAKLLDFGIARDPGARSGITRTGLILGTPEYMAPEQARGQRDIGPAADVFSLGCMMYECFAGHSPFAAEHVSAVLVRILFDSPAPLTSLHTGIPEAMSGLIARMMAKDPADRPANAHELLAALTALETAPDIRVVPTLPARATKRTASSEQLFTVVLASPPRPTNGSDTVSVEESRAEHARLGDVEARLRELGAHPERLLDGSLVLAQAMAGDAGDHAALAARLALTIQDRWPQAVVALAIGLGAADSTIPLGEVVDRASSLVKRQVSPGASVRGIRLDPTSAGLLERRFAVAVEDGLALLTGREANADDTWRLLGRPTSCVGRRQELATLTTVLDACIDESEARAVLVTAPAGGGKSRLRHEFLRRAAASRPALTILHGASDMMAAGAAYGSLAAALRLACGIAGSEAREVQRQRLAERVARSVAEGERTRIVGFLGEMCGVPFPDEGNLKLRAARQDPRIMRDQISAAIFDWLAAECRTSPVLLVLEDLHWGDALTIQLIDSALRTLRDQALMVLALARPEGDESSAGVWSNRAVMRMPLAGLSKKACGQLIQEILGKDVRDDLIERLYIRSAGNPLYLEEFIRSHRDGGGEELPRTVLAMLQARVGRLDTASKRVLLAASVFGATFWLGGLSALLAEEPLADADIEAALRRLVAGEWIERRDDSRFSGEVEYVFRHALMREAAYSLLRDEARSASHLLVATFLENAGEADPMVIAEQFRSAGAKARAIPYYVRAAVGAFDCHDLPEALERARHGLSCEPQGEDQGVLLGIESAALWWLNDLPQSHLKGLQALPLLPTGGEYWCKNMVGLLTTSVTLADAMTKFAELSARLMSASPRREGTGAYLEALAFLVVTTSAVGQREAADACLERMRSIAGDVPDRDPHWELWIKYAACYYLLFIGSDPWEMRTMSDELRSLADSIGLYRMIGSAVCYRGFAELQLTGTEGVDLIRAGLDLLEQRGEAISHIYWHAMTVALTMDLVDERTVDDLERTIKPMIPRSGDSGGHAAFLRCALAHVHATRGRLDEAEVLAAEAVAMVQRLPAHQAFLLPSRVRLALLRGDVLAARERAEAALLVLRSIGDGGAAAIKVRLACTEAFSAAGDDERARAELVELLRHVHRRAERITDQNARHTFLTRHPDNVRVQLLAARWSVSTSAA